ncbi:unnamed protein product [Protopolystoma xenopodis]|uniref:Uncharacterized protein n=1 Tax=Protopolystoma xenopodis TaxID=117903 RepID=A0A3S5A643_9PLAT|nr:unnamed protein product [Protopolystoma xenopodis]
MVTIYLVFFISFSSVFLLPVNHANIYTILYVNTYSPGASETGPENSVIFRRPHLVNSQTITTVHSPELPNVSARTFDSHHRHPPGLPLDQHTQRVKLRNNHHRYQEFGQFIRKYPPCTFESTCRREATAPSKCVSIIDASHETTSSSKPLVSQGCEKTYAMQSSEYVDSIGCCTKRDVIVEGGTVEFISDVLTGPGKRTRFSVGQDQESICMFYS